MRVIDLIQAAGIDAQISVKPTQLGYDQNPDVCFKYCLGPAAQVRGHRATSSGSTWRARRTSTARSRSSSGCARSPTRSASRFRPICSARRRTSRSLVPLGSGDSPREGRVPRAGRRRVSEQGRRRRELLQARVAPAAGRCGAAGRAAAHRDARHRASGTPAAGHRRAQDPARAATNSRCSSASRPRASSSSAKPAIRTRCLISYGEYWFPWYMRRLASGPPTCGSS